MEIQLPNAFSPAQHSGAAQRGTAHSTEQMRNLRYVLRGLNGGKNLLA